MKLLTNLNLSTQITQIKNYVTQQLTGFLPRTGGTLTGNITFQNSSSYINGVESSNTLYRMQIGTINGSNIDLHKYVENDSNNCGQFIINVADDNDTTSLIGKPDGTLTWNGNSVLSKKDVTEFTGSTIVDETITSGSYHKIYKCGPIVCVHINIKPPANYGTSTALITGLPIPIKPVIAAVIASDNTAYFFKITEDGNMLFQDSSPTTALWINGAISYLTMS